MKIKIAFFLLFSPTLLYSQNPDLTGYSFALDAGHGGAQSGAVSAFGFQEKWISLFVARHLRDFLLEADDPHPNMTYLHQNFPNPFNALTVIRFELPNVEEVSLIIYDMLGREVVRLIENEQMSGIVEKQWDGKNGLGNFASSGIYVSVLITENEVI